MDDDATPGALRFTDGLGPDAECKQATPHAELLAQLLDPNVPKTEREHAAAREIKRLRQVWEDTRTQRDELLAHLTRKEPLPAWAVEWIRFYGA